MNNGMYRVMMPLGSLSLGLAGCGGAGGATTQAVADGQRPNIVVFYLDDLDNAMLGCYGGYGSTPNIDRIAENGIRFTRYYPSSAVSQPSRYSMLTGKHASRNVSESFARDSQKDNQPFVRWNTDMSADDVTLAEVMKQQGYHTGFVGKWHLGFPNYDPLALAGDADPEDPATLKFMRENYDRTLAHVKEVSGFDEVINLYSINIRWIPVPDVLDHHNQEWVTQGAVDFLDRAAAANEPFLLCVATSLPHAPGAISSLESRPATPLGYAEESDIQPSRASVLKATRAQTDLTGKQRDHFAAMKWVDDGVGVIMAKLEEMGLTENTLVILASDNDGRAKMSCYDGRVPLVMQWSGTIDGGVVCDELVSNIDFAPTIYDLCGATIPEEHIVDGVSLRPLIENSGEPWRESLYLEVLYTRGVITKTHNYVAVRYPREAMAKITPENRREYNQEGTKISQNDGVTEEELTGEHVRYGTNVSYPGYYDFDQLYDLRTDPLELTNLAYDRAHEMQLLEMKKLLTEYSRQLPGSFGEFK